MTRLIAAAHADEEEDADVKAVFPLVADIEEEEEARTSSFPFILWLVNGSRFNR